MLFRPFGALLFAFLRLGIIRGSVWANVAWGKYWGRDVKGTQSLTPWVLYAFVFHVRHFGRWLAMKPKCLPQPRAVLPVIGFLFALFTWFGVNFLLCGLHAYTRSPMSGSALPAEALAFAVWLW